MQEEMYSRIIAIESIVLIILMIILVVMILKMGIVSTYRRILRDYYEGKWSKLEKKIDYNKVWFRVFSFWPWQKNNLNRYNVLCWHKALIRYMENDEDGFLRELEAIKNTFGADKFVLSLFCYSKGNRDLSYQYYQKYMQCDERDINMVIILKCLFLKEKSVDLENICKWSIDNLNNPSIKKLMDNIKGIATDESNDRHEFEAKKNFTKWFAPYIAIAVFLIYVYSVFLKPAVVENFMVFSSIEEACDYAYQEGQVLGFFEGEQSALVVTQEKSKGKRVERSLQKYKGGWKFGSGKMLNILSYSIDSDGLKIIVLNHNDDYYIMVESVDATTANISDSCGSEFVSLPISDESKGLYPVGFYAYIEDYEDDYWISINGNQITFN